MDVRGKSSNDKRLIDADKMLEIYKKRKAYGYKWMWAGKTERRTSMRIWTDDEYIEVEPNDVGQLEAAMLFKAEHIKAKADPELFAAVADMLSRLWDSATKRVDVVRCRECKYHKDTSVKEHAHCSMTGYTVEHDDFCSCGERKDCSE